MRGHLQHRHQRLQSVRDHRKRQDRARWQRCLLTTVHCRPVDHKQQPNFCMYRCAGKSEHTDWSVLRTKGGQLSMSQQRGGEWTSAFIYGSGEHSSRDVHIIILLLLLLKQRDLNNDYNLK